MKKICYGISITAILLFLFLYPSQALTASRTGLHLWFDTLLPTLLPFMILSGILIRADLVRPLVAILSPFFQKTLMLSPGGTYALFMGFLCGCPMGAKTVSDLLARGQLTLPEAQYLLGFCNNISPSFIITFLVTEQLGRPALMLPSLVILYGSPLFYGILTNPSYRRASSRTGRKPAGRSEASERTPVLRNGGCMHFRRRHHHRPGRRLYHALRSSGGGSAGSSDPVKGKGIINCNGRDHKWDPRPDKSLSLSGKLSPFDVSDRLWRPVRPWLRPTAYCQKADGKTSSGNMKNAHLSLWKYVRSKLIISALALFLSLCFLS